MNASNSSAPPGPKGPGPAPFRTRSGNLRAQRGNERSLIDLPVEFAVTDAAATTGTAKNISIGGAFIETDAPAPFGATISLSLPLGGAVGTTTIVATVRWCKADGMGVQFGTMGARDTHALTELLKRVP